ncbi:hypothetical protein [Legionella sp. WA2022007384]
MKKTGEKPMHRKMEGYYKKEKCDVPREKGQDLSSYDLILKLLGPYGTDTRIIRDENNEVIGCLSVPVPNFRPVQSEEDPEQNLETQKVAECVQMTLPLMLIQEDDLHFDSRTEEQSFVPRSFK